MLPVQPLKGKYQRPDLRNHRKLLVVDGDVAFTGSLNVITTYNQRKKNIKKGLRVEGLLVRFEGPVVVGHRRDLRRRLVLRDGRAARA